MILHSTCKWSTIFAFNYVQTFGNPWLTYQTKIFMNFCLLSNRLTYIINVHHIYHSYSVPHSSMYVYSHDYVQICTVQGTANNYESVYSYRKKHIQDGNCKTRYVSSILPSYNIG